MTKLKQNRSKLAAALLALFLGGLGIHKFYLGESGQGIIYLLLCWTLIPVFFGFLECLYYLSMTDQDFEKKFCFK